MSKTPKVSQLSQKGVVHSLVDFNLQVPANAAWFYVLAAIAASPYPIETRRAAQQGCTRDADPVRRMERYRPAVVS